MGVDAGRIPTVRPPKALGHCRNNGHSDFISRDVDPLLTVPLEKSLRSHLASRAIDVGHHADDIGSLRPLDRFNTDPSSHARQNP